MTEIITYLIKYRLIPDSIYIDTVSILWKSKVDFVPRYVLKKFLLDNAYTMKYE